MTLYHDSMARGFGWFLQYLRQNSYISVPLATVVVAKYLEKDENAAAAETSQKRALRELNGLPGPMVISTLSYKEMTQEAEANPSAAFFLDLALKLDYFAIHTQQAGLDQSDIRAFQAYLVQHEAGSLTERFISENF